MILDWHLVADVGIPILTLFLGAWVNRWFEKRPVLTSYFSNVSAFKWAAPDGKKVDIFTHSVVLRNSGKKSATNVRFRHASLPSFQIFPAVDYSVVDLPDGTKDIVVPVLVPKEEITISYLYFPPLTYAGVNAGIRSDEGFAQPVPVLLQRQYPKAWNVTASAFFVIGLIATLYVIISLIRHH